MLRMGPKEVRSYRYFLDVVGPLMSGTFDAEFWLVDVPRVCLVDAALWHAVVSLSTTHECQSGRVPGVDEHASTMFTLRQLNFAIRWAVSSDHLNEGKMLVACMALLEGQQNQAHMHLRAGCNILAELDDDDIKPLTKSQTRLRRAEKKLNSTLEVDPPRNLLTRMVLLTKMSDHGGLVSAYPDLKMPNVRIYHVWKSYITPSPCQGSHTVVTPETVLTATRAAESCKSERSQYSCQCTRGCLLQRQVRRVHRRQPRLEALLRLAALLVAKPPLRAEHVLVVTKDELVAVGDVWIHSDDDSIRQIISGG